MHAVSERTKCNSGNHKRIMGCMPWQKPNSLRKSIHATEIA